MFECVTTHSLTPPTILNFFMVFRNLEIISFGYLKPKKSGKDRNPGKNLDFLEIHRFLGTGLHMWLLCHKGYQNIVYQKSYYAVFLKTCADWDQIPRTREAAEFVNVELDISLIKLRKLTRRYSSNSTCPFWFVSISSRMAWSSSPFMTSLYF